jgi:membrane-associated phospholipid phosphatase
VVLTERLVVMPITLRSAIACLGLAAASTASAQTAAVSDPFGNTMRIALPLAAAAFSVYRDDRAGVEELGVTWAASQLATEGLKRAVHDPRPTGGSHGFASGHTSSAFAAAGYLHRRYDFATAAPAYVLATMTAYNRVHKGHHYTRQVAAGAAVGLGSAFLLTKNISDGKQIAVSPTDRGIAASYSARW